MLITQPPTLQQRIVDEATTVQDMADRVVANGGEPNYADEKLGRAFRATVRALLALGWSPIDLAHEIDTQHQPMTTTHRR